MSLRANGATLTTSGGQYTHHAADGTVTVFSNPIPSQPGGSGLCGTGTPSGSTCSLPATSITDSSGRTVTLEWDSHSASSTAHYLRLNRVSNSYGYSVTFTYANNSPGSGAPPADWFVRTGATLMNGTTTIGTVSYNAVTGATEVTDMAGRVWRIAGDANSVTGVRRPGASADSLSISASGSTITAVRDGVTTSYSRSLNTTTNVATMTVTDANSEQTTIVSDMNVGRPTSVTDPLSRTTSYQYDTNGRLTRVTAPLGNYVAYTYDARGNVTEVRRVAQSGSGLSDIVTSASFDSSCSNPVTCNQPNSTTDAGGNTTDYTYDSTHGGVLTVTGPAPTSGADRPQTRYSYTLSNGEYRLTGISACASGTASSCVGTADETRTVIGYDGNGNVNSVERRDGTGALSAISTATYTALGDVETVDGPLSGTADTTRFRYNAARQLVGVIGPDPDGSGSLEHRATRTVYGSDGLPTAVQRGSVASQSDTDWAAFSPAEEVQQSYDANGRPIVQRLVSGSTTYALTQAGYDALGRVECVAQRMNASEFAPSSLPSDACTPDAQGSDGPDRIARTTRDEAGQVTLVQTGYGTSAQSDEVATTYTANGQVETVTDGEGNRTTFVYDGHDRLSRTRMPSTTQGAGTSSTTDYEELGYDAAGNVTNRRLRDGNSIAYSYDELGRLTDKDLPGSEPTVSYAYDLLGRMTSAATSTRTISFTFDALGRRLTETSSLGTMTSAYDLAGRRTSLAWPSNALVIGYNYLVTGEMSEIRENPSGGNALLASFTYDDMGRLTLLTYGDGSTATYSYDAASRLAQTAHDFNGSVYDLTLDFTYNPAGQIATEARSNTNHSYISRTNGNVTDTINGLNQTTATASTSLTHDARGNITAIGSASYGYTSENLMVNAPGSLTLSYDPLLRLNEVSYPATGSIQLQSDGGNIVAEYNASGSPLRRYVFGPGQDEPLVWYEIGHTTPLRYLHADERGSIWGVTDGAGNLVSGSQYDEYGNAADDYVLGRFGYTGQAWIGRPWVSQPGLYYYRARIYNARLGRFMQADPIGYSGGMNLYAYVGGDPVNRADPQGLCNGQPSPIDGVGEVCGWPCSGYWMGLICVNSESEGWREPTTFEWGNESGGIPESSDIRDALDDLMRDLSRRLRRLACGALSYLPEDGRARLGADASGGAGFGGAVGAGISIHRDGSVNVDRYYGYGLGLGLAAGPGLSIDNRANSPGRATSHGISVTGGIFSADFTRDGLTNGGASGGFPVPRGAIWSVTATDTTTETTQLISPICQ